MPQLRKSDMYDENGEWKLGVGTPNYKYAKSSRYTPSVENEKHEEQRRITSTV